MLNKMIFIRFSYEIEADASSEAAAAKGEVRIYRQTPKNVKPYEIYYKYV